MDLREREGRAEQGRRIQAAAEEAGLPLSELARRLSCSRALVYQYISGQVLAQPDRLQEIAEHCGKPLAWFYLDESTPLPSPERDLELERLRGELEAERLRAREERGRELYESTSELAAALGRAPDFPRQRRVCERLVERAADLRDDHAVAEAEFQLGNACYSLGDLEATRAAMTRAIAGFRALGLEPRERAARQTLGAALAGLGERDRALAEFETVIAGGSFSDVWRGRLGRADVLEALGRGEAALAELAAAEALIAEQPESAERSWAELYVRATTVNAYLLYDDFATAGDLAAACVPLAEELAAVAQDIEAHLNVGWCHRRLGAWADSLIAFDDAVRLARLTGDGERHAAALACRAELLAAMGRGDQARAEGKDALAAALGLGSVRGEVLAHLALSEAYRRGGDGNEALYHARQAVAAASGHSLVKLEAQSRLAQARARHQLGDGLATADARRAAALAESVGARWLQGAAALVLAECEPTERAEHLAVAQQMAAETSEWELRFDSDVACGSALAGRDDPAAVALLHGAVARLLALRGQLTEAGLDASLLDEAARLTAVVRCARLLRRMDRGEEAERLVAEAAWPPLAEALAGESEE